MRELRGEIRSVRPQDQKVAPHFKNGIFIQSRNTPYLGWIIFSQYAPGRSRRNLVEKTSV